MLFFSLTAAILGNMQEEHVRRLCSEIFAYSRLCGALVTPPYIEIPSNSGLIRYRGGLVNAGLIWTRVGETCSAGVPLYYELEIAETCEIAELSLCVASFFLFLLFPEP